MLKSAPRRPCIDRALRSRRSSRTRRAAKPGRT